jgi:hypothetical protein
MQGAWDMTITKSLLSRAQETKKKKKILCSTVMSAEANLKEKGPQFGEGEWGGTGV